MDSWAEENYESGPFCRHFSAVDCDQDCICGHRCTQHDAEDGSTECYECDCKTYKEKEATND